MDNHFFGLHPTKPFLYLHFCPSLSLSLLSFHLFLGRIGLPLTLPFYFCFIFKMIQSVFAYVFLFTFGAKFENFNLLLQRIQCILIIIIPLVNTHFHHTYTSFNSYLYFKTTHSKVRTIIVLITSTNF